MKKKTLKFGLAITLLLVGILLLVPLGLQWFTGRMSDDGSLVTIKAAKRVYDLRYASNDKLVTSGNDFFHRAYPRGYFVPTYETRVWNAKNGKPILRRPLPSSAIEKPTFASGGRLLFEGWFKKKENRGGMTLTRADSGAVVRRWETVTDSWAMNWTLAPDNSIASASIELDRTKNLKTMKLSQGGIGAWDVVSGKMLWLSKEKLPKGNLYWPFETYLAFSPDSKLLAEAHSIYDIPNALCSQELLLRDALTGRKLRLLATDKFKSQWGFGPKGGWHNLTFSPDGQFLAVFDDGFIFSPPAPKWDCAITLWSVKTGQKVWESKDLGLKPESIAFSPDGNLLACGYIVLDRPDGLPGGRINLLDTKTGKLIRTMTRETRADALNYAWGARTRKIQRDIKLKTSGAASITWTRSPDDKSFPVTHLAFSPDGKRLAAAHEDGVVKIWAVK